MKQNDDRPVLVIGATGFLGRRVVAELAADGYRVRCLARTPAKAADPVSSQVEVVQGDMLEPETIVAAARSAQAVIAVFHTLSPQSGRGNGSDFIDVEQTGLRTIVDACKTNGVRRLMYVTAIGVAPDAPGAWSRGRQESERLLFGSGLDVTVLRPGLIVGHGGDGFAMVEKSAGRRIALVLASSRQKFRTVAVEDLAHQLVHLLGEPRAFGKHFDVGSDDVYTIDQMIDLAADHLHRPHPTKVHLPRRLIAFLAPLVERAAGMAPGAVGGFVGKGSDADMIGDPTPIRPLLDRAPEPFAQALARSLA
jgi:uncharacterized protein YbjT (DUF2867 family)